MKRNESNERARGPDRADCKENRSIELNRGLIAGAARWTVLLGCSLLLSPVWAETVAVGDVAPDFERPLLTDDSSRLSLSDFRGQVVYLDFWASWCGPCLVAMPKIEGMKQLFDQQEFAVLAVNVDRNPDRALRFLNKLSVSYPSVYDQASELPKRYGLQAMPSSYVIDKTGKITLIHEGFRKGDEAALISHIQKVLDHAP